VKKNGVSSKTLKLIADETRQVVTA
jgi:hypothetical protein